MADDYRWNVSTIAAAVGLHRDTVRKRLAEADIKPAGKKGNAPTYHLNEAMQAIFAQHQINVSSHNPDSMDPKSRLDWYRSESERIKFHREVKDLVHTSEARDDLAEVLKRVASFFDSLPDKMERRKVFTREQLDEIERSCDVFRNQLHQDLMEIAD